MWQQTPLLMALPGGREFDLPPRWDGRRVAWSPWETVNLGSLAWHGDPTCCTACGVIDEQYQVTAFGTIHPNPGETTTEQALRRTRSGRLYTVDVRRPARPLKDLCATRCRHCGHDSIYQRSTDTAWDLDDTDYTAEGSTA
ncbi:hypothetical protein NQ036_03785 [Brevibacterium sp. 91QC2O2]|uniref:hypothetical protein n=1 Tax=Brevibacterium TaxID=1696 RepID=UPI00211CFD44|nr:MULTISPECIES: hypothetical protein [unclassified Brevibacterium]MCQ9367368.1 hypothetical protein [Brevibacterium sp. 91QC2O2]MCQ9384619.1 hypothetical protein [Brevibacterium sp. 68QC2CO]